MFQRDYSNSSIIIFYVLYKRIYFEKKTFILNDISNKCNLTRYFLVFYFIQSTSCMCLFLLLFN